MIASFLRIGFVASLLCVLIAPSVARAETCEVPERIHISALIFDSADSKMKEVEERLKHESWDVVAKSLPDNYAKNAGNADGWFVRSELAQSQYRNAALLPAGQFAAFDADVLPNITRVDEVRPHATCDDALRDYPTDPWALRIQAAFDSRRGDNAAAIADLSRQIANDPDHSETAYYARASTYYTQLLYRKALDDVYKAGNSGETYVLRAMTEAAMGSDALATADAGRAEAQLHGNELDEAPAFLARGVAYSNLGYYASAIEQFNKALAHHQSDAYGLSLRAFPKFASGDDAGAQADLLSAARSNPKWESPLIDLALVRFSLGDVSQARNYARRAHALAPKEPYAALWLDITSGNPRAFVPADNSELNPDLNRGIRACESVFYRGITYYVHHDRAKADPLLREAATRCPIREHERVVAQRLLKH